LPSRAFCAKIFGRKGVSAVEGEFSVFRIPGRTELGGDHTEQQGGGVLAAAVGRYMTARAKRTGDDRVTVRSEGFGECSFDLSETGPEFARPGTFDALARGVCDSFLESGNSFGGFEAEVSSEIPAGAGLASSAAFGVLIGSVISGLYFGEEVPPEHLAAFAERAETLFFGGPGGKMDALACAAGCVVSADFQNPYAPRCERVDCDFSKSGYTLVMADSGTRHGDPAREDASLARDMRAVAQALECGRLCEAEPAEFFAQAPVIRDRFGERAMLRAWHYFSETQRAQDEAEALRQGDFEEFLRLFRESAESSERLLRDDVPEREPERGPGRAILTARELLGGDGAARARGDAGAAQCFVKDGRAESFIAEMELRGFPCMVLHIL